MKITNNNIIKDDDPLIREKSLDVKIPLSKEDIELINAMRKYVLDSTNPEIALKDDLIPAVGISAIQVGIPKKITVIIIKDDDGNIVHDYTLINAKIISNSIEQSCLSSGEGCLSVDNKHEGYVYRSKRIKVKAYSYLDKKDIIIQADDYLSIVLQHELDHFQGKLYYDTIDKKNPFIKKQNSTII